MLARDVRSGPVIPTRTGTPAARGEGRPPVPHEAAPIPLDECWRLLASVSVGRLVFTEDSLPAVHPVNFVVDGRSVVIRTASARKLAAAERGDVVAFQADAVDPTTRTGWSVLLVGHASPVHEIDRLVDVLDPAHRPWAVGSHHHVISVAGERVTGRRLLPPEPAVPTEG